MNRQSRGEIKPVLRDMERGEQTERREGIKCAGKDMER